MENSLKIKKNATTSDCGCENNIEKSISIYQHNALALESQI